METPNGSVKKCKARLPSVISSKRVPKNLDESTFSRIKKQFGGLSGCMPDICATFSKTGRDYRSMRVPGITMTASNLTRTFPAVDA
jgi:hypothetical protein